jgi:hypothetical protein
MAHGSTTGELRANAQPNSSRSSRDGNVEAGKERSDAVADLLADGPDVHITEFTDGDLPRRLARVTMRVPHGDPTA